MVLHPRELGVFVACLFSEGCYLARQRMKLLTECVGSIGGLLRETCIIRLSAQVSVKYNSSLGICSSVDDLFIGKGEVGHLMDEMMHRHGFERLVV